MENFIRVTAIEYTIQGVQVSPARVNLEINQDLIAAFLGKEVLLKGNNTLYVGNRSYKNILRAQRATMRNL